jgi:hypothetical protein
LFYVIGSVGFLPFLFDASPVLGEGGFILGSALIGSSQAWKVARLSRGQVCGSPDTATAIGVEAGAMVGALCFLVGTLMFASGRPLVGGWYERILGLWLLGSASFTAGALFLGYRHFAMGL